MSDSDFSDVDDAIQPSKPSLMSFVTVRLIVINASGEHQPSSVKARLGGDLYPFTAVHDDTITVVARQGNTDKLTAAARSQEMILEISASDDAGSNGTSSSRVVVNILNEEEPDAPLDKQSADGNLRVRMTWSLGDNPSHPRLLKPLAMKKKERAPAPPAAAPASPVLKVDVPQLQSVPTTQPVVAAAPAELATPPVAPRPAAFSAQASAPPPPSSIVNLAPAPQAAAAAAAPPMTLAQLESNNSNPPQTAPFVVAQAPQPAPQAAALQPQPAPPQSTSPPAMVPINPAVKAAAVEYDAATLQNCVFLHVEFVRVLKLKSIDPTTYVQFSDHAGSDAPPPSIITATSVVKRNSNPVYHSFLDAPAVIPKASLELSSTTIAFHVFEKKLVSAAQVIAQGAVVVTGKQLVDDGQGFVQGKLVEVQCSGAGCSSDTKALLRVTLWTSPTPLRHSLHPMTTAPLGDAIGVLQFEITRAELKKEECPAGVYFASASFQYGPGEIQTERTLAVMNDVSAPLWLFKTNIPMKYRSIAVDLSIVRVNSLRKTEDTVAIYSGKFHMFFDPASPWVETTLELALPPSAEAEKKEKSNEAGILFVKHRTVTVDVLQRERDIKRATYLQTIVTGDDDVEGGSDPALAAPRVLSKYSVKVSVVKAESLLFSAQTVRFSDSQLILKHSGNKESRSGVVSPPEGDSIVTQHALDVQIEPLFQVQQLVITNTSPSTKGKILGRGVADIDVLMYQPNVPFLVPVVLEARYQADGISSDNTDEKNFAEDIALLNRANRPHFGVVTLSVVVQRLDYWSNSSVLNVSHLRLVPSAQSQEALSSGNVKKSFPKKLPRTLAVWFRNHRDFSIPLDHVKFIALDEEGAMQGALQLPTTFPLNSRGQLAPLCFALLPTDPLVSQNPLEDLHRTLASLVNAVEQRVHTVEGLGPRSSDEIEEHIYRSAMKEISIHVRSYIEVDLTSTLMEAAKLSDDIVAVRTFADMLRGATQFAGELPLAELGPESPRPQEWLLQCSGSWSGVAKQLRASSMPDLRVHGFDPFSEQLWVIRARTAVNSSTEFVNKAQQRRSRGGTSGSSLELHVMARDVVIPEPPHFEPIVSETSVSIAVVPPPSDEMNTTTFNDRYHIAAFMFGPCHNSRTDVVLSVPTGNPIASIKLDMLLRSGKCTAQVDRASIDGASTDDTPMSVICDWFHGNRGVSESEERQRRKDLETEWRVSQKEPQPQHKLLVTYLGRSENVEPPRLSGSTLTRCDGQALLVGGLGETSQPVNSIFSFSVRDGLWMEWTPTRVSSWEHRLGEAWRKSSTFAVDPATSFKSNSAASHLADTNIVFNPRHGHSAAFDSEQQYLVIYGGIGPEGFDPASVTEDGYRDRYVSRPSSSSHHAKQRHRRIIRYGYLSDVWVVDLKCNALRKVTPAMSANIAADPSSTDASSNSHHHHSLRWRHSAVVFEGNMFVFGGKSVVVKSVTVPYNMQEGSRRDDIVPSSQFQATSSQTAAISQRPSPSTTYFIAEEICCSLESISVLNLEHMEWSILHTTGAIPSSRYGHGTALVGGKLYLFGGRNSMETLNDLYVLDMHSLQWEEILPFGTLAPPPLDLFGFCHSVVDGTSLLVVTGGRTVGAPSQYLAGAATEKLTVYYFNIATSFWHTLAFSCAPGPRRIAPAICSVTSNARKRPSSSSLKRLPFAFTPVIQILLVGGERGVVDFVNDEDPQNATLPEDERARLTSREEGSFFDGNSILPRPSGIPCVLNLAIDPGASAMVPPSRAGQGRIENIVCSHLRFRDATIPGWALEKSVNRLHIRPPAPAQPQPKKEKPLTKQQQEAYLERLDADLDRRKKNQEQRMHDAYAEVREQAATLVRDDAKQWGDEQWVSHYYRVYYKPAIRYARSRNLPAPKLPTKLQAALSEMAMQDEDEERYRLSNSPKKQAREAEAEAERRTHETKKLLDATEMSRVNAQLYYQPMAARKESNSKLHESLTKPSRPQSARRVTQKDIEESLNRLHRGPPSPLSSQKFGPTGRGAYSPAPRR
jgi:hypothetical protein